MRSTMADDYPPYAEVEHALLKLLANTKGMEPRKVYPLLADHFKLTSEQRVRLRHDKDEPVWNNRVQWARRKLVEQGLMHRQPHGIWRLNDDGERKATR